MLAEDGFQLGSNHSIGFEKFVHISSLNAIKFLSMSQSLLPDIPKVALPKLFLICYWRLSGKEYILVCIKICFVRVWDVHLIDYMATI